MTKKVAKTQKVGRGSDQFVVRLPPGMRNTIAREAEKNGRSMNAEIVDRLTFSFEQILTNEGLAQVSKRLEASAEALESLLFDLRDIDLDSYIADQRAKGKVLTRNEAIRFILASYLAENGYSREGGARRNGLEID